MSEQHKNLQDIVRGFREPRIILTALELGIFQALLDRSATSQEVAVTCGIDPRASQILLAALASMGVLSCPDGRFVIADAYRDQLDPASADNVLDSLVHTANMWRSWSELAATARLGHPAHDQPRPSHFTRSFIGAMRVGAMERASQLAAELELERYGSALDLGGGPGSYAIAFALANPELRAVVYDLPDVTPIADEQIAETGLGERVTTHAGDYLRDPVPSGFDMIWISSIVHMHSPQQNAQLIAKAYASLNSGGRMIVREFLLDEDGLGPISATLFAVNMLAGTNSGRSYRASEISKWMQDAGLTNISVQRHKADGLVWGDKS